VPAHLDRSVRTIDIDTHAARDEIETRIVRERLREHVFRIEAGDECLAADRMRRVARRYADRGFRMKEETKNGDHDNNAGPESRRRLAHRRPHSPRYAATVRRARSLPTMRKIAYCRANAAISALTGTTPLNQAHVLKL